MAVFRKLTKSGIGSRHHSEKEIAKALRERGGVVARAAQMLDMTREAVWMRIQRSPALKQAQIDGGEMIVDVAESKLIDALAQGRQWAVELTLKTKGRKRGYVQRHEFSGPDGGDIPHRHTLTFNRVLAPEEGPEEALPGETLPNGV